MVEAGTPIFDKDGSAIATDGNYYLCRCGASKSKPFCDGSHIALGFVG